MSDQFLKLKTPSPAAGGRQDQLPLGQILLRNHVLTELQLSKAVNLQKGLQLPLGDVCVAEGFASPLQIAEALSEQRGLQTVDLARQIPDHRLLSLRPAQFWLRHRAIPRAQLGNHLLVATSRPERPDALADSLAGSFEGILPSVAEDAQVLEFLSHHCEAELAQQASQRVEARFSCRNFNGPRGAQAGLAVAAAGAAAAALAPQQVFAALTILSIAALLMFFCLRSAGFAAFLLLRPSRQLPVPAQPAEPPRLPRISVLVPMFREERIAEHLIRRLAKLSYPPALLDVLLVLEEHDSVTRAAIARSPLPDWMRVVEVPAHGGLTTKPRAMNYALDFCNGDIIGVWDAEDAPSPNQLMRVARRFHQAGEDVACLQGVLDYYNPNANWISRCFTIEYASWFRVIMPGLERLGLVLPLGGTTMFIRRAALEALGGWDAHNVTEDADLGVRIARSGFKTQMLNTTTFEEANCRPWPWVRQRSRWLKGFMVTYLVHIRQPRRLLAELGLRRFLGLNAFFLGTLGHFLLAPFLWTFWLMLIGLPHPAEGLLPPGVLTGTARLILLFEACAAAAGAAAIIASGRGWLILWLPAMPFYYPLGVLAAYKALYELFCRPFFWDKTAHGSREEPEGL